MLEGNGGDISSIAVYFSVCIAGARWTWVEGAVTAVVEGVVEGLAMAVDVVKGLAMAVDVVEGMAVIGDGQIQIISKVIPIITALNTNNLTGGGREVVVSVGEEDPILHQLGRKC